MTITSINPWLPLTNQIETIDSGGMFSFQFSYPNGQIIQPSHGSVVYGSGMFLYMGKAGYTGLDSFTFQIPNLETGETTTQTTYVRVNPVTAPAPADLPVAILSVDEHVSGAASQIVYGNGTDDARPTLSGTGAPGTVITLRDGTTTIGTVTADATGHWSLTPSADLTPGAHTFTANNASPYDITYNWIDPKWERMTVVQDASEAFTSASLLAGDTALHGAILSVASVTQPGHGTVTVTDAASGAYVYTPEAGYLGEDRFTYVVKNQFGDEKTETVYVTVRPEVLPPVITEVVADSGRFPGPIWLYGTTYDLTPTVQGTADAGMRVTLYNHGKDTALGTAVADASGHWSWTPSTPLPAGEYNFTPVGDLPNGAGTTVASNIFVVRLLAPDVPQAVITSVLDDVGPVQGNVPEYFQSDDPTPTLVGTAQPGVTLKFSQTDRTGGWAFSEIGQLVVGSSGQWSFTTPALTPGQHDINVLASNADGSGANQGSVTRSYFLQTDLQSPTATAIHDDIGASTGLVANGGTTDDARPTFSGTAQPNSQVYLSEDDSFLGVQGIVNAGRVDSDGHWAFTPSDPLPPGKHTITYFSAAGDGSGLIHAASPIELTISADAQGGTGNSLVLDPVMTGVIDDVGVQQGMVLNGGATNDTRPTFVGTAEPGTVVSILNGYQYGQAVADDNWQWSFTPSPLTGLAYGGYDIALTSARANGWDTTPSVYSFHFDVSADDNVSPRPPMLAPVITTLTADVGSASQVIESGGHATDATPTLSGTAEPGSVVEISDNGRVIGTATAGADWLWTFTPGLLTASGPHHFTAVGHYADGSGSTPAWYAQDYVLTDMPALDTLLAGAGLEEVAPAAAAPEVTETAMAVAPTVHAALLDLHQTPAHAWA